MRLTGELKDKVDKAETMADKKDIIAEAGMELNDDEVEMVSGGAGDSGIANMVCPVCKRWQYPYFTDDDNNYKKALGYFNEHVRYCNG